MSEGSRTTWNAACPPELREIDQGLVTTRRARLKLRAPRNDYADSVGVALSGGGIRSATFALGVFQGLAKLKLLGRIDYLSTVSGGGYFGSFYGRLISRQSIENSPTAQPMDAVQSFLNPEEKDAPLEIAAQGRQIIRWLRENGRYLAPTGSGDYLTAIAVMLRNWFAIQTIVLVTLTALFLALRVGIALLVLEAPGAGYITNMAVILPLLPWPIWLSPLIGAAGIWSLAVLFPLTWAYWIASLGWRYSSDRPVFTYVRTFAGPCILIGLTGGVGLRYPQFPTLTAAMAILCSETALSLIFCLAAMAFAPRHAPNEIDFQHSVAKRLSNWLRNSLVAFAVLALLGIIDSVGQTLYALNTLSPINLAKWFAGLIPVLMTLVSAGQKILLALNLKSEGGRVPWQLVTGIASLILIFVTSCALDYETQMIVWRGGLPAAAPSELEHWAQQQRCAELADFCKAHQGCPGAQVACAPPEPRPPARKVSIEGLSWLFLPSIILGVLTVLALLLGAQWDFVNLSTLLPMYSARLTRAYLGASNPARYEGQGQSVTDPIPGDDVNGKEYWIGDAAPWRRGGPVHLINVTINETIDGRSQIEQHDRRGVGMAISPAGISVGIRNHRSWQTRLGNPSGHILFGDKDDTPEDLALSEWAGISGAAVSTGMGSQGDRGLSVLAGVLNVRLGYWWNSGTRRGVLSTLLFPVQRFLVMNEWFCRFPGTAKRHWYLSDGGHFENTAAYELVRRRIPLIIVSDAGADPTYQFDDIANLVRKARIDFNAEITFLSTEDLARLGQGPLGNAARFFGTLEELKPGATLVKSATDFALPRQSCAALARVTYADDPGRISWLIVLKPILCPGDPADLINYGKLNPTFPNQTTADQFFDEAQWESYRKLGELIALRVLAPRPQAPYTAAGQESPLELLL